MTLLAESAPSVFVSYSRKDRQFAQRLVIDLQLAGADVWWDVTGICEGDFIAKVNEALRHCGWFVLVLTPNAIESQWVNKEVNAALNRHDQGFMHGVFPLLAAPCAPGSIPPLWDTRQRYDLSRDYDAGLRGLLHALRLDIANQPVQTVAPPAMPHEFVDISDADVAAMWDSFDPFETISSQELAVESKANSLPTVPENAGEDNAGLCLLRVAEEWESVRKVCKQKARWVAALLQSVRPILVVPGNPAEIVLQTDFEFHLNKLGEPAAREAIEWTLEQVLDCSCCISLVLVDSRIGMTDRSTSEADELWDL